MMMGDQMSNPTSSRYLSTAEPGHPPDPIPEPPADPAVRQEDEDEQQHEGGTEKQVGDRTGPGAGYDQEPKQEPDEGGVATS
jgi:hypothetical protein